MVPQPFIFPQTKDTTTTTEVESCGAGLCLFIIGISKKCYFILYTFTYYINMVGLIMYYFQFKIASRSKDALIVNNRYGHSNPYVGFFY